MELVSLKVTVFTVNSQVLSILKVKTLEHTSKLDLLTELSRSPTKTSIFILNSTQKVYYLHVSTDISAGGTIEAVRSTEI